MEHGYKKLIVHAKADELAFMVYEATSQFPSHELLGMVSQMRRAALSIPANIAEGYTRLGDKEKKRFFNIALGSLAELEYFVGFSRRLKYIDDKLANKIIESEVEVGKLLGGFNKKLSANS